MPKTLEQLTTAKLDEWKVFEQSLSGMFHAAAERRIKEFVPGFLRSALRECAKQTVKEMSSWEQMLHPGADEPCVDLYELKDRGIQWLGTNDKPHA